MSRISEQSKRTENARLVELHEEDEDERADREDAEARAKLEANAKIRALKKATARITELRTAKTDILVKEIEADEKLFATITERINATRARIAYITNGGIDNELTDAIVARMDERHLKIQALMAEQEADELQRQRIQSGEMDEELIKAKTDGVKITPTIAPQKTASVKAKTDGEATRTRMTVVNGDGNTRPKGGDIMVLFNRPALIRCVFGEHKTAYYGLVEPAHKRIRTVMKNGTFRAGIDKGVKSYDTKTVKIEEGGKMKNKDVADTSEPERERTEWTTKDLWIKSCKGEQNLYSSTKDGWKEIYYWNGDLRMAGQADNNDARWVHMMGAAYDGVKLDYDENDIK